MELGRTLNYGSISEGGAEVREDFEAGRILNGKKGSQGGVALGRMTGMVWC